MLCFLLATLQLALTLALLLRQHRLQRLTEENEATIAILDQRNVSGLGREMSLREEVRILTGLLEQAQKLAGEPDDTALGIGALTLAAQLANCEVEREALQARLDALTPRDDQ